MSSIFNEVDNDGTCNSTSNEEKDLEAVVNFAKEIGYTNIDILGFSLGAAISLIYASSHDDIRKIMVVSAPSDFDKIENQMYKPEAWIQTIKKFELSRFLSIRADFKKYDKIKPIDIIDKVKSPTLFIAGLKDPTVHSWHTKALYDKALCEKEFKFFEKGIHAEDIFLQFKEEFSAICLDWLDKKIQKF